MESRLMILKDIYHLGRNSLKAVPEEVLHEDASRLCLFGGLVV